MTSFASKLLVLQLLPVAPRQVTAVELHQKILFRGHVMSLRQVQRTLLELERLLPIKCNDLGRPYGWCWAMDASAAAEVVGLLSRLI